MFHFFKFSIYTAIITLFLLSFITVSDVFIHTNQFQYYVITVIIAAVFFAIGLTGIVIYKNFKNIYLYLSKDLEISSPKVSVRKLLFIFGLISIMITLFCGVVCMGLIERMIGGTALFG